MRLYVHREFKGRYEPVGVLQDDSGAPSFSYAESYLSSNDAAPISISLPLASEPFDSNTTAAFFDGLVPEGSLRRNLADVARADRRDFLAILNQVRNEPIGALVFSSEAELTFLDASYEELPASELKNIASMPESTALDLTLKSRISLAGAQTKIGLYHSGDDPEEGWHLPRGGAPSTHILKTCSEAFPGETVCEALYLKAAKRIDLPAANCFLIESGARNPILAVERYDRRFPNGNQRIISGLPAPLRLHQEDMCQVLGISSGLKYEATSTDYLNLMSFALTGCSSEPTEDRFTLGYFQLLDYLLGNCDNHLKNWSILYSEDWNGARVAPLYDVVNTTIYPQLAREMGVSFGGSRVVDDVTADMIYERLGNAGLASYFVKQMCADMREELVPALEDAASELAESGFPEAKSLLDEIEPGIKRRLEVIA